jgi:pimeloyl-ACP methyl ester carboxylesterase
MDWLEIERAFLWGHSDGAVIAAIIGFTAPERVRGLILEAFHYYRMKPGSRGLFETLAYQPEALGAELCERFALEFGRERLAQPNHQSCKGLVATGNRQQHPEGGSLS